VCFFFVILLELRVIGCGLRVKKGSRLSIVGMSFLMNMIFHVSKRFKKTQTGPDQKSVKTGPDRTVLNDLDRTGPF
jgi:hypothetical protein